MLNATKYKTKMDKEISMYGTKQIVTFIFYFYFFLWGGGGDTVQASKDFQDSGYI